MTVVLVHRVPETSAVWDLLVDELSRLGHDSPVRLSPHGFGAPMPKGWSASVEEYRSWTVSQLEAIGGPVDLVGHDWGGGHVLNVVATRPDLIRSWVSDSVGIFDSDYVWHDLAQQWQRPGIGEEAIGSLTGLSDDERVAFLVQAGMGAEAATAITPAVKRRHGQCILGLYRSAVKPAMAAS